MLDFMFYFPNRFGTIVTLNTNTVAYIATDQALLSLMSIMFGMQNSAEADFKLRNLYGIYKIFLGSTMLYEAGSITVRTKLFQYLDQNMHFA